MAVNLELLKMARQHVGKRHLSKYAFVAAGDPAMGAPPPTGAAPAAPADCNSTLAFSCPAGIDVAAGVAAGATAVV